MKRIVFLILVLNISIGLIGCNKEINDTSSEIEQESIPDISDSEMEEEAGDTSENIAETKYIVIDFSGFKS